LPLSVTVSLNRGFFDLNQAFNEFGAVDAPFGGGILDIFVAMYVETTTK
jgi:hypothetical protein